MEGISNAEHGENVSTLHLGLRLLWAQFPSVCCFRKSSPLRLLLPSMRIRAVMNQVTRDTWGATPLGTVHPLTRLTPGVEGVGRMLWTSGPVGVAEEEESMTLSFRPCHLHKAALSSLCRAGYSCQHGSCSQAGPTVPSPPLKAAELPAYVLQLWTFPHMLSS